MGASIAVVFCSALLAAAPAPVFGQSYENWMADNASEIGQKPLRQVIFPGSHDAATYGEWPPVVGPLAQAQSLDITDQLNAGSRYFDLRFEYRDYGNGNADYWNFHGVAISTDVRMGDVLRDVLDWSSEHPKEILMLDISIGNAYGSNPSKLKEICSQTLGTGNFILQPSMVPKLFGVPWPYDMSLNEIWALPGSPRIITNWSDCTGGDWSVPGLANSLPFATRYADRCSSAQAVIDALAPSLNDRTDDSGKLALGIYTLFIQATPEPECFYNDVLGLAPMQGPVIQAIEDWLENYQNNAERNLNVMAGDFIGTEEGDTEWPIVAKAVEFTQGTTLSHLTQGSANSDGSIPFSCTSYEIAPGLQMMAYPLTEGRAGLDSVRFQGVSPGQLELSRQDFPAGNFDVRVDCTAAVGSTQSLTVHASNLAGTSCPYGVGGLIQPQGGAESGVIDVMAPGCLRRPIPPRTADQIMKTWNSKVQVVTATDFFNLQQGPDIADAISSPHNFGLDMEAIYGGKCFSLQLPIGTLISFKPGNTPDFVLSGGCVLRSIPNNTTLQTIENRYGLTVQSLPEYPATFLFGYFYEGPDIPDSTDTADFEQAMEEIYGS